MYQQIADAIANAPVNEKIATFHLQVLLNAQSLAGVNAHDFCQCVGVKESYAREFQKVIKVAELIGRQNLKVR